MLLLYHYGGTYFDLDTISRKSVPMSLGNFVVRADVSGLVNNAVMHFSQPQHRFLELAIGEVQGQFVPHNFTSAGPNVLTRNAISMFFHLNLHPNANYRCQEDLNILPKWHAYPIDGAKWRTYYDQTKLNYVLAMVNQSFVVHYFNRITTDGQLIGSVVTMEEDQPLYHIFKENCPITEEKILRNMLGKPY